MIRFRLGLVALFVIGCASPANESPPTPTPSPPAAQTVTPRPPTSAPASSPTATVQGLVELPPPITDLEPGTYTKCDINPELTFTVGDGWTAVQAASGFFDVEQDPGTPDVIAVQFARAAMTVGIDTADTIAADIEDAPHVRVVERTSATIDGRPTRRLVVETDDPVDLDPPVFRPVMTIPAGPLSIASGRRLQIDLLDVHMGVLAVLVGGSIAQWDRTLAVAQPVLDSVIVHDLPPACT